ncbi:IS1 family transposase [Serratia fonticola]
MTYTYQARERGVKEKIVDIAFNGASVSRYGKSAKSRYQYCHPYFKKLTPKRITSSPVAHADVALICELDEQSSFVDNKAHQRWLWYAYNTKSGGILAYTFGPRTDETCRELLALLTPFNIGMITRDDWGSYRREVPKDKHLTGRIFTQRIERNNLTLRTYIKRLACKTICFSWLIELHEKVNGAFIGKYRCKSCPEIAGQDQS